MPGRHAARALLLLALLPCPVLAQSAETVVAVVDETPITLGELIAVRQGLPDQFQKLPDEILMQALIQQIADQQLLANAAEAAGTGRKASVRLTLKNQRRAVMAQAYLAEQLAAGLTEETIAAAYKAQYTEAEPVEEIRAAHILLEDGASATSLKKLLDEGADFASLAAVHGTDGTAARGGDMGYLTRDMMLPAFFEAALALEVGAVSEPVQTPFGWHLIKLLDKRVRPVPPLDEVRAELATKLRKEIQERTMNKARSDAKVSVTEGVPATAIRDDTLID